MADTLEIAAYDICVEVREGRWTDALKQVSNGQPAGSPEVIAELRRRCPGHNTEDYQRAIARAMFVSR